MEERVIIEGQNNVKRAFRRIVLFIAGFAVIAAILILVIPPIMNKAAMKEYDWYDAEVGHHVKKFYVDDTSSSYQLGVAFKTIGFGLLALCTQFLILSVLFYIFDSNIQITVTNMRVYGIGAFKKRIDLPLDHISAIGTCMFKGIFIGSSSGRIRFFYIENRDEIHKAINNLLMERQGKQKADPSNDHQAVSQSVADELKTFKDLLDSGIITQEEFDAKKKQLLGL